MNLFIYHQNAFSVFLLVVACLSLQTCDSKQSRHSRYENNFKREPNFREDWNFPSFEHNPNPYSVSEVDSALENNIKARLTELNGSPQIWSPIDPQKLSQVWSPKEAMTSPPTKFPKVPSAGSEMPLHSMVSATMYNLWLTSSYLRLMAANELQNMDSLNNFNAKPMNSFSPQMSSGYSSGSQLGTTVSPLLAFINKLTEHPPHNNLSFLNQDISKKEDEVEVTLEKPQLLFSTEDIESQIHANNSIENTQPQKKINDIGDVDVDDDSEMQIEDVTEEVDEDYENEVSGEDLPKEQLQGTHNNQAEIIKTQGQQEKVYNNEYLDDDTEVQVEEVSEEIEEDDENEYINKDQLKQQLQESNKNQTELLKTQGKQEKIYQAKDLNKINTYHQV